MLDLIGIFLYYLKGSITAIGVVVISFGVLRAIYQLYMLIVHDLFSTNYVRLQFGNSLILALEFMVGADIVDSLLGRDYHNLGLLILLVFIRIVLSYFLYLEVQVLIPRDHSGLK